MTLSDGVIFIDSNQYLDLYRVVKGKRLLKPLLEQRNYFFVTEQIVAEVQRNKLRVAALFLTEQFQELKTRSFDLPDHFLNVTQETITELHHNP